MSEVHVIGTGEQAQSFIDEVLTPMGLGGTIAPFGVIIRESDMYGSDPEDVAFELDWHGCDARVVEEAT